MAVVVDTSFVLALLRAGDVNHASARGWYETLDDDLITSPLTVAEMDYMLNRHAGPAAVEALWRDLESGAYIVRWWADALSETIAVAREQEGIGLADASLVALAARLRTDRIATFDHRHFRTLEGPGGQYFTVLPADAP